MINKIARTYFNLTLATRTGDAGYSVSVRKAIAFAIYVKTKVPCSVLRNWSIRDLSRLTGCSQATCRKRLSVLRSLRLVRVEGRNLVFKHLFKDKVRNKCNKYEYHTPKQSNVYLDGLDYSSCKSIERGLECLVIVEDTRHKNYYRRLIGLSRNPGRFDSVRSHKRAKELCRKKGLEGKEFEGGELSYIGIAGKTGCSRTKAVGIVKYAESRDMVVKHRQRMVFVQYVGYGIAGQALEFMSVAGKSLFATRSNVYYQLPNIYSLGSAVKDCGVRQLL